MIKCNVDLTNYEKVNRQTALLSVGKSNIVAKVKDRGKTDLYEISTMKDLQEVVNLEQKGLYCDELTFYKEKIKIE